jgi:hypothetical protein
VDNLVLEFTIGLVGAVIGGLIVSRVDRRLAAFSSWYRTRTAASRAKREHIVSMLVANPLMLAVAYLDALVGVVFLTAAFFAFVQAINMIDADSKGQAAEVLGRSWSNTTMLVLMALVLVTAGYFVSRRISFAQEAWRTLGQANGLPKVW